MWKRGISDSGLKRLAQEFLESGKDPYLDVHKIRYAEENGRRYTVFPIYVDDSLAKITDEDTGDEIRVPISDLLEFYTLYDFDNNIIHSPEEYSPEEY
jgi:hypothetical protein